MHSLLVAVSEVSLASSTSMDLCLDDQVGTGGGSQDLIGDLLRSFSIVRHGAILHSGSVRLEQADGLVLVQVQVSHATHSGGGDLVGELGGGAKDTEHDAGRSGDLLA